MLWLAGCGASRSSAQRALVLVDAGQPREAALFLEQHLRAEPGDLDATRLLIRIHGTLGDLGSAQKQADRLARLLPAGSPEPWLELGSAYELAHRYEEALRMYDYAAAVAPANPAGSKRGGLRALRWGELDAAEPRLAQAVQRDANDPETWHALGLVNLKLGRPLAAKNAYAAGVRADPSALENRLGLATVALQEERPAEALAHYDALIAVRPEFRDAYLGRSWSLILLGRLSEAEQTLERAEAAGADRAVVARQRRALSGLKRANIRAPLGH